MKQTRIRTIFTMITLAAFTLSACIFPAASADPTSTEVNLEAIYTLAAATVMAGETGTASAKPTITPTVTETATPAASITPMPSITPITVIPIQPIYTAVILITTTGTPGTLMPTATGTLGAVGCNDSAFIRDVTIPDKTKMDGGHSFTKTWSIQNTGTCTWNSDYRFTYFGGEALGSDTTKIRRTVGPGVATEISLKMVAPMAPGTYTSTWRMADDKRSLFGTTFNVVIIVSGATYTPVPSATKTLTPTKTATGVAPATATPTATATTPVIVVPTTTATTPPTEPPTPTATATPG